MVLLKDSRQWSEFTDLEGPGVGGKLEGARMRQKSPARGCLQEEKTTNALVSGVERQGHIQGSFRSQTACVTQ